MLPRPPVYLSVTLRKLCQIWAQVESACRGTFLPLTPTFGSARPLKPGTSPMRLTSCPMRFARYGNDFCNYDCDKSPYHEFSHPALPARLRGDPLQGHRVSIQIPRLRLQELWHLHPLQPRLHPAPSHVGSKGPRAIQVSMRC